MVVTTAPFLVNSQNEIGVPARFATPRTTTLALAPTAVRLPPKSAPSANDSLGGSRVAHANLDSPGVTVAFPGQTLREKAGPRAERCAGRHTVASASVGGRWEARTAGCTPASTPTTSAAATPPATEPAGITAGQSRDTA